MNLNRFVRQISRRLARQEHGAVILETAIMIMVLLIMAFGIMDFGRVMYITNALQNTTRDGARWAAVQSTFPATAVVQDTVCWHFNGAVCGSTGTGGYRFGGPAIAAANVSVTAPACSASTPVKTVTIVTTYPFNWLTPLPRLMRWTTSSSPFTTNIHAKAIFKYEWCS